MTQAPDTGYVAVCADGSEASKDGLRWSVAQARPGSVGRGCAQ